jgi:hyperosmotically inducible protein
VRTLVKLLLAVVVVGIAAFLIVGVWAGRGVGRNSQPSSVGTTGAIDVETARERGAKLGEKAATTAEQMRERVGEAALTTKIKAKMALDDSVRARAIDVSTKGSTVTLSGTVRSRAEHDRAVGLARETDGITKVVDQLRIDAQR